MTDDWRRLISKIHQEGPPSVIVVTGGGASGIADLLRVPGGSRTVLEAVVPYSTAALTDWLGRKPEHFCVEETALAMAAVAHQRAARLQSVNSENESTRGTFGIACTASLASARPKKGEHRCHIAVQSGRATFSFSLVLTKEARTRDQEENLVGQLLLGAYARAAGITEIPPYDLLPGEQVEEHCAVADPLLADLLAGKRRVVWSEAPTADLNANLVIKSEPSVSPVGVLCGSFHPLHHGHRLLRQTAERLLGGVVAYEMSIVNVDKPPLDFLSIERRRLQCTDAPLALTSAPTFVEKTLALPGVVFIVGIDTAERIVQPKYYGDDAAETKRAIASIRQAGCRFLVAGRKIGDDFKTLADLKLPAEFADLFQEIPANLFREDISSTDLRRGLAKKAE